MEWFVKAFVKASLFWLACGVTLGVAMAIYPVWTLYRPVHLHLLLLGFVAMMIFGVAYHVIPRFVGHALHSRRAAGAHWWLSNAGLVLMAIGFVLRAHAVAGATVLLGLGGVSAAGGAYTFAYLLWRTIDGPRPRRARVDPASDAARIATGGPPVVPLSSRRGNEASRR